MGSHPDGLFMYGYALGSAENWKIQGGGDALPEWMPDDARYEGYEFRSACERRLLADAGFDVAGDRDDTYDDRLKAAEKQVGVEFQQHGYHEYPMYALVAKTVRVYEGDAELVDLAALRTERVTEGWDGKLAHALEVLGITPTQERPGWLVSSYYG